MKKIIESLWLLLIGVILVSAIYAGITITKEVKASDDSAKTQQVLTGKIADLEGKIADQQQTINNLGIQIANVKKLAATPKQVLAAIEPTPAPEPQVITKTVTKTVVVKEKPKPTANITIQGVGSYHVEIQTGDTAFSILQRAAVQNQFTIEYTTYEGLGVFITAIAGQKPTGNEYWAFYYNGKFSDVGASAQTISEGDTTFWRLESF